MKVLLDTHAMLWWWSEPERIPQQVLKILSDPATTVLASAVSAYEMAYKHRCGKLSLPPELLKDFPEILKAERWDELLPDHRTFPPGGPVAVSSQRPL
jgi:PIN domain nuclease of toxin-antitoxin system